jgi:arginine-tRNA-protein transferase
MALAPPLSPPVPLRLIESGPHACPYLPQQTAVNRALVVRSLSPHLYRQLMDAGFRRSGRAIYQPVCPACRACRPLRVPVSAFRPSRSQRRVWRRNSDLAVEIGPPQPTQERFELYSRYVTRWHRQDPPAPGELLSFLYDSPTKTIEFTYRLPTGALVAVGICDLAADALSSVYFYFDPDHARRGLGTLGALREIHYAAEAGLEWYYLGFWIAGCRTMQYKADYRPHEVLGEDGVWRRAGRDAPLPPPAGCGKDTASQQPGDRRLR